MTTETKLHRLCGRSVRCACMMLALAFCASAFAGPSNNVIMPTKQQFAKKIGKKVCYVMTSASAIPEPCDRLSAIPTTASPMTILGHAPERK